MIRPPTGRTVVVAGVLVALLIAGALSQLASGSPDGLERVAEDQGFAETAKENPNADGPLADYRTDGVDDERLSGAAAGVLGVLVVLGLSGGLVLLVRRRSADAAEPADERTG